MLSIKAYFQKRYLNFPNILFIYFQPNLMRRIKSIIVSPMMLSRILPITWLWQHYMDIQNKCSILSCILNSIFFIKACSFCIDHNTFLPVKLIKPFRKVDMKVLLKLTLSGPGYVLLLCCWGDPNRMFNFLLQDSVASFFGSPPWAFLCGRLRESLIEKVYVNSSWESSISMLKVSCTLHSATWTWTKIFF